MSQERNWIAHLQAQWPHIDLRQDTHFSPTSRQILTTDMVVEDVHFRRDYFELADIGWKSLAVNYSDIAATGGVPQGILINIGIPQLQAMDILKGIYSGIAECCQAYGGTVLGGDTVQAPQITLAITVMGYLPSQSQPGRRHTARPGDVICVSGPHGLSQAGFYALNAKVEGFEAAKRAHLRPQPRLKLGQRISQTLTQFAMLDSSDGLADAAIRLAEASGVDITLHATRLALHPDVAALAEMAAVDPIEWVLYGGEDFELVIALAPEMVGLFPELQVIGSVTAKQQATGQSFLQSAAAGQRTPLVEDKTYQHFDPPPFERPTVRPRKKSAPIASAAESP